MTKTPKRPRDTNQLAKLVIDIATGEKETETLPPPSDAAGHGREGGKRRAKALSPARRSEIAQKAARARWKRD